MSKQGLIAEIQLMCCPQGFREVGESYAWRCRGNKRAPAQEGLELGTEPMADAARHIHDYGHRNTHACMPFLLLLLLLMHHTLRLSLQVPSYLLVLADGPLQVVLNSQSIASQAQLWGHKQQADTAGWEVSRTWKRLITSVWVLCMR